MLTKTRISAAVALASLYVTAAWGDQPAVTFESESGRLQISIGNDRFATYVYADAEIWRPYFTNVHAPGGVRATRHHPPRMGIDSTDHGTMHPGIWLAFGDLGGHDFWRNKARVEHVEFIEQPTGGPGRGAFSVRNRYVADGKTICIEVCRHQIIVDADHCLVTYDSQFSSDDEFYFGDQEELGLGFRVRSELRVKGGQGRIKNSDGSINEEQVWGRPADWCDYSGIVDGQRVGLLLMPSPRNFRRSWFHARDYGFTAANPFGRNAFTRGAKSRIEVRPGETFRLGYGVLMYSHPANENLDLEQAYRDYVELDAE